MSTQHSYDEIAAAYADRFQHELRGKPLDRALLDVFASEVEFTHPIADISCGPGHIARYLNDLGLFTIGVDLSPRMIEIAAATHPGIEFRTGDMRKLDLADHTFGGLVAFYSIIHVSPDDLPVAFAEFFRVLRPGAPLLLSFHIGDEVRHLDEMLGHAVDLDFHFYPRPAIESLLTAAGFEITATLERAHYPTEVATTRAYVYCRA
ncbi:class I SAM-dependent DNA methyltransferase [Nocardia arthritidis]|uniref:class I SAM-dependent DNA methyltransferase n=1 Tax=Nocardia arthritidis TaxID=228602 RepID=UPI00142E8884|nr:class I SAM-dependent methyltransferase [Nocardia arthritidis]